MRYVHDCTFFFAPTATPEAGREAVAAEPGRRRGPSPAPRPPRPEAPRDAPRISYGAKKEYGVRPCSARSAQTLRDQLGLVPGTKSKIEDGSAMGAHLALGAAVADFRLRFGPQLVPRFSAFRTAVCAVGSLLADHPWMAKKS